MTSKIKHFHILARSLELGKQYWKTVSGIMETKRPTRYQSRFLFNCMDVRDPSPPSEARVYQCNLRHSSKSFFVPSISICSNVTSGASIIPFDSRQFKLQRTWERIIHGKGSVRNYA